MHGRGRFFRFAVILIATNTLVALPRLTRAQIVVPLTADAWNASDSIRFESYLGRPSVYINRGVALARNVAMRDGVIEYDWAATARTNFLGASFHATAPTRSRCSSELARAVRPMQSSTDLH